MKTALRTTQLAYSRNQQILFEGLDLELNPGQGLAIYGANGSGKTSLLRVLTGLMTPTSGQLEWQGEGVTRGKSSYHQVLHYLSHQPGVKNNLSVQENLYYSQSLASTTSVQPGQVEAALAKVGLLAFRATLARQLSAGQKRRLALARLLTTPKPLWILDEPFTNLDQESQSWLSALLEEHLENQGLVIVASHQPLKLQKAGTFKTLLLKTSAHV